MFNSRRKKKSDGTMLNREKIIFDGIVFKSCDGLNGIYASRCGSIYSAFTDRILKQCNHSRGYLCVGIWDKKKQRNIIRLVHRLVASAWLGLDLNSPARSVVVDHINGDKTDNSTSNLQVTTQRHNATKDRTNKNGLTGVRKKDNRYYAQISVNGEYVYLGSFETKEQAHARYKVAAMLISKHNYQNFF